MNPAATPVPRITVVSAPACHFCEDAEQALAELAQDFAIEVDHVALESDEGRRLATEHRPAMSPLVLVDGAYFSSGRLSRKKLVHTLTRLGAGRTAETRSAPMDAGHGR